YPCGRYTLLYSHGNAEDLGLIAHFLTDLARLLGINVLCYDYAGYGQSVNPVYVKQQCYNDIQSAYTYLVHVKNVNPKNVLLYGKSVGSGPTSWLAQQLCTDDGMILHSPFLSVIRVVLDVGFTTIGDLFPNVDRVQDFTCPAYVIHGTCDEIVPFYHGESLFNL
ncbi:predicted protein, partial [Thalassiosira pseudonana CCMP1335]